jgi:hypothetical protein
MLGGGAALGQQRTLTFAGSGVSATDAVKLTALNREISVQLRERPFVLHSYLPAEIREDAPIVIYSSGSGGWHDFDQHLATVMAEHGMPVFGVSTHSYLRTFYSDGHPATSSAVVEDYRELIRQAKVIAKVDEARPVIIAGWSLGAGYAPLVASDPRVKSNVLGVIILSLSRDNETSLNVSHRLMSRLLRRTIGPSFDVSEYLGRVAPIPMAIIQAAGDRTASPDTAQSLISLVGQEQRPSLRLFQVTAGRSHSFAGGREQVDQSLEEAINWIRSNGSGPLSQVPSPLVGPVANQPLAASVARRRHAAN